jgi:hypothetical protein
MTPSPITVVRYQYVAEKLSKNGFRWEQARLKEVNPESLKISFALEWQQFLACVSQITGIPPRNESAQRKSAWKKYFQHVIHPTGRGKRSQVHENEHTFSDVVFEALRKSLQEFVDPNVLGRNTIVLKNSSIGFIKGIPRTNLGLGGGHYLVSRDGRSHHGCFVFGSRTKQRESSDAKDDEEFLYEDDMTASIELKQDTNMCLLFEEYDEPSYGKEEPPEWLILRSLLGQAMVFSWDVLHCLARRGVRVQSVPVVLLAGTTESMEDSKVCCLDARIEIPNYVGEDFSCLFNRIISFNGTVAVPYDIRYRKIGLANDDSLTVDSSGATVF